MLDRMNLPLLMLPGYNCTGDDNEPCDAGANDQYSTAWRTFTPPHACPNTRGQQRLQQYGVRRTDTAVTADWRMGGENTQRLKDGHSFAADIGQQATCFIFYLDSYSYLIPPAAKKGSSNRASPHRQMACFWPSPDVEYTGSRSMFCLFLLVGFNA